MDFDAIIAFENLIVGKDGIIRCKVYVGREIVGYIDNDGKAQVYSPDSDGGYISSPQPKVCLLMALTRSLTFVDSDGIENRPSVFVNNDKELISVIWSWPTMSIEGVISDMSSDHPATYSLYGIDGVIKVSTNDKCFREELTKLIDTDKE